MFVYVLLTSVKVVLLCIFLLFGVFWRDLWSMFKNYFWLSSLLLICYWQFHKL